MTHHDERDWYSESINIVTSDADNPPQPIYWEHLRALWDVQNAMTLRMADIHARAQQAEAERDSLRVQLQAAQDALRDLYRDIAELKVPDPMTAAKADMEARGVNCCEGE